MTRKEKQSLVVSVTIWAFLLILFLLIEGRCKVLAQQEPFTSPLPLQPQEDVIVPRSFLPCVGRSAMGEHARFWIEFDRWVIDPYTPVLAMVHIQTEPIDRWEVQVDRPSASRVIAYQYQPGLWLFREDKEPLIGYSRVIVGQEGWRKKASGDAHVMDIAFGYSYPWEGTFFLGWSRGWTSNGSLDGWGVYELIYMHNIGDYDGDFDVDSSDFYGYFLPQMGRNRGDPFFDRRMDHDGNGLIDEADRADWEWARDAWARRNK